ncbi:hypothetical protein Tco_1002125 [Tanacetum coccineum]|uniref:Maturase K n=1 Tax=Tanacetum coccineum TaxID=301880 RepID=A0ABQ5F5Q3_9ASTR
MSSPNRSTSDIEDAFSSMNILNYTSVSSDYFPASSGSSSFNSSENSTDNMIPPVFSSFYNNPCLKDVQAFYAKELPIHSTRAYTSNQIYFGLYLWYYPPSLLFVPRFFLLFHEETITHLRSGSIPILPQLRYLIHPGIKTCDLVSPSSSVYTPTPPQIFEIGKCFRFKMYLKHS